jgi:signal transduction histidine kinase
LRIPSLGDTFGEDSAQILNFEAVSADPKRILVNQAEQVGTKLDAFLVRPSIKFIVGGKEPRTGTRFMRGVLDKELGALEKLADSASLKSLRPHLDSPYSRPTGHKGTGHRKAPPRPAHGTMNPIRLLVALRCSSVTTFNVYFGDLSATLSSCARPPRRQPMETNQRDRLPSAANVEFWSHSMVQAVLVLVLCYLAARLGGTLIITVPQTLWPLWPGCAVLVAILLVSPRRTWPIFIPAGLAGFVLYDLPAGVPIHSIAVLQLADIAEIFVVLWGVDYFLQGVARLDSLKHFAKYVFVTAILGPLVVCLTGSQALTGDRWISGRIAFLSDGLAFLTLAPAILGWVERFRERPRPTRAYYLEAAALFTALFSLSFSMFVAGATHESPAVLYSLVPLLLWSALRFGSAGAGTSASIVALVSIWGAVHGRGPFAETDPVNRVIELQLFLLVTAVPFMILAVLVEERKRHEAVLHNLTGRLINAQEEERARIARELHDDISQRMAFLQIGLEQFEQTLPTLTSTDRKQLHNLTEVASEMSTDLHSISHQLHPAKLDLRGLVPTMASFCREFSNQHELQVIFLNHDVPGQIPKDVALCVFRIVQEALRNIVKHTNSLEAKVELSVQDDELNLCISDSGAGFNPESIEGKGGLGLVSMRERVGLIGGQLAVESKPSDGTRIRVRVPLSNVSIQSASEPKHHNANT